MDILTLTDRSALETYFRQDLSLHLYSLGDLDDFYWPQITVFGTRGDAGPDKVTLLYRGDNLPVLLAFGALESDYLYPLQSLLPDRFYAHFSPGLENYFSDDYQIQSYGDHYKMDLEDPGPSDQANKEGTFQLTEADLPEVNRLYRESYPDNAFNPLMLLTGQYFGVRQQGKLVSIAGVHVYSASYKVAALGNITTHPDERGKAFARAVTARLCQHLAESVDFIGLNVKSDNQPALTLYQTLGFRISIKYGEFLLKKRQ